MKRISVILFWVCSSLAAIALVESNALLGLGLALVSGVVLGALAWLR